jgi:hypothetical protein
MIEKILQQIWVKYNSEEHRGIFLSAFDKNNTLIISNGVLITDKPLNKVIEMIYHWLIESHWNIISKIICDIITIIQEKHTIDEINSIDISHEGICIQTIDNSKSGVLLPGTVKVNNIQEAFWYIKQKNHIEWNVNIYTFWTERIEII